MVILGFILIFKNYTSDEDFCFLGHHVVITLKILIIPVTYIPYFLNFLKKSLLLISLSLIL